MDSRLANIPSSNTSYQCRNTGQRVCRPPSVRLDQTSRHLGNHHRGIRVDPIACILLCSLFDSPNRSRFAFALSASVPSPWVANYRILGRRVWLALITSAYDRFCPPNPSLLLFDEVAEGGMIEDFVVYPQKQNQRKARFSQDSCTQSLEGCDVIHR